jgi:hypothetical protein
MLNDNIGSASDNLGGIRKPSAIGRIESDSWLESPTALGQLPDGRYEGVTWNIRPILLKKSPSNIE